jgi:thymidylate synthase (FAD)
MKVELVSLTKPTIEGVETAEDLIAYCARVSNPSNQMNTETAPKLLSYLIRNKHWSPFEMASMCVSIETSRAIAAQILRHRSFSFQEFSQRYSSVEDLGTMLEDVDLRWKAVKNRQSSSESIHDKILENQVHAVNKQAVDTYITLIDSGVSTETARMVLPLTTSTKIYMNGTVRSWIHYLAIRADEHTQKEHRLIAEQIKNILEREFPTVYEAIYSE